MSTYTDVLPLPDTGFPLPEGHPEFADCAWCGHRDRASLMYNAVRFGDPELYCVKRGQCNVRWEDNRRQREAAPEHAGEDPYAVAEDDAETPEGGGA